eukprot:s508_g2.t1
MSIQMSTQPFFCLRRSAGAAVDRAECFNDWTAWPVDGLTGEYHQKNYVVLEVRMEENVRSPQVTPQEYRCYGHIFLQNIGTERADPSIVSQIRPIDVLPSSILHQFFGAKS